MPLRLNLIRHLGWYCPENQLTKMLLFVNDEGGRSHRKSDGQFLFLFVCSRNGFRKRFPQETTQILQFVVIHLDFMILLHSNLGNKLGLNDI